PSFTSAICDCFRIIIMSARDSMGYSNFDISLAILLVVARLDAEKVRETPRKYGS
ncbi:hypothetical protein SLEP1_g58380, partial [Rubroshorea leprosula]